MKKSRTAHPRNWQALRERLAAREINASPAAEVEKQILHDRARRLATPLEQLQPRNFTERTAFRIGQEQFAIETEYVWEVARLGPVTPVPGSPPWVMGLTSIRGVILLVADLRGILGLPGGGLKDSSLLLVCGIEEADLAIVVDQIVAEQANTPESVEAADALFTGIGREYVRGVTHSATVILDGAALLTDARLFVDYEQKKEMG